MSPDLSGTNNAFSHYIIMNASTSPSSAPAPLPAIPRRDFLKTSAGLAAVTAFGMSRPLGAADRRRSVGANERIRIGVIGCGRRGTNAHMKSIMALATAHNCEIVALADPWKRARESANANVRERFGRDAKLFVRYQDLLAMDGIDAVVIASPDHHHTTHLEAAARAGKHIYVEKPLATEMDKLVRAVDAVKAAGTVVQVGTQIRSLPAVVGAREVIRSGKLGAISRIDEVRNAAKPYWYDGLAEVRAEDVDWSEFLGDRPARAFDPDMYSAWMGYYEFCQGPVAQWGAHFIDTVHFLMDSKFPESCMCLGGTFTWRDEHRFTSPDCVQATWIYPGEYMVTSSNNFGNSAGNSCKFYGTKGTLDLGTFNQPTYSAEGGPKRDGQIRGKVEVAPVAGAGHFPNWLECMRTGETPRASIDAGYLHAVAVLMAVQSYATGRRTIYDQKKRTIATA
jgi:predicted dehydrogenase